MPFTWRLPPLEELSTSIYRVAQGQIDQDLLLRFYRTGRRDGKRGRPTGSFKSYVLRAVEMATERVASEYIDQVTSLVSERSRLEAEIPNLEAAASRASETASSFVVPKAEPLEVADRDGVRGKDMGSHLAQLQRVEAEARSAELRRSAESAHGATGAARDRLAEVEALLPGLDEPYIQRVVLAHSSGSVIWSRYCDGYEEGLVRRRKEKVPSPETEFEPEWPEALPKTSGSGIVGTIEGSM